jgi:hypothetical protein
MNTSRTALIATISVLTVAVVGGLSLYHPRRNTVAPC